MIGDKIGYAKDAYAALKGADALLLVTEWREFRVPGLDRVKKALKQPRSCSTAATSTAAPSCAALRASAAAGMPPASA
jgi:hypothetical protein